MWGFMMSYDEKKIYENLRTILRSTLIGSFDDETIQFLDDLKSLSIERQHELFSLFVRNVEYCDDILIQNAFKECCELEGHIYSDWYERISSKDYSSSPFKNKVWCKKCKKCNDVYITFIKPDDFTDNNNITENDTNNISKKLIR